MEREKILDALRTLHQHIDLEAERIAKELPLRCAVGCASCCVDDVSVFEVEAARIQAEFGDLLSSQAPHPRGRCAFLDEQERCRIYPARPYVCRTQGLPLRWLEEKGDEVEEFRDICALNEQVDLTALEPNACWPIGPVEERLSLLQQLWGTKHRLPLRSLFGKK
ncbi:MAG: YkgJ family cysteine cluster protein [Myxococcota bacterium]|jgi:Fe-S-cluster containining protein|nr:YkgJ family cysteine cluster protein [Myxococcota bacterium]